jgi:membrane-bound lytic murein transglycosylase B
MNPSSAGGILGRWSVAAMAVFALGAAHADNTDAVARAREQFVARMVKAHGFDRNALEAVLQTAVIDQAVLDAISRPAERVVPWYEYRNIFVTPQRIEAGVQFWQAHADALQRMSDRYGVAPEMLVAIIGVETFFGQRMGRHRVLDSLATLAFAYPPRAKFFASELESFLLLAREEDVDVSSALGSYAGAMGAGQFIPSSYRAYAVDGNADGKRDLWSDWDDVFASVANYFKKNGWQSGQPVVEQATRSTRFDGAEPRDRLALDATVGALSKEGYVFQTEAPDDTPAGVFALEAEGGGSEYWVGYENFRVITRYNSSPKYALAAYELGLAIRAHLQDSAGSAGE